MVFKQTDIEVGSRWFGIGKVTRLFHTVGQGLNIEAPEGLESSIVEGARICSIRSI